MYKRQGQSISRNNEIPFSQVRKAPWRVDELVVGRAAFCTESKKLHLNTEELLDGQRHRMETTPQRLVGDPKYQDFVMEASLVKFSGYEIVAFLDFRAETNKDIQKPEIIQPKRVGMLFRFSSFSKTATEYRVINSGTAPEQSELAMSCNYSQQTTRLKVKRYVQYLSLIHI